MTLPTSNRMPAATVADIEVPDIDIPGPASEAPVRTLKSSELAQLGKNLNKLWEQYRSDRIISEQRWLRNLRQYLGFYDPEIEAMLARDRSRAYPKITRIKCVSVLSRLMSLMFPGNERNWSLSAGASENMTVKDVREAIQEMMKKDQDAGSQPPSPMTKDYVTSAARTLAAKRAEGLAALIDDQLEELGGDQTLDYIALNRKVIQSGIIYGVGVLRGPFARKMKGVTWGVNSATGQPEPAVKDIYKPMFEFLHIWDFYPDFSAKTFMSMDGYFTRVVMSRSQVSALREREDFLADVIKEYLDHTQVGNYKAQNFETELRAMGVKINVNDQKTETTKYEVIVWHGPITGHYLQLAGCEVPADKMHTEIDAEVWMIDGFVIKADMNPWHKIGVDVRTVHTFLFDEDDTAIVGNGLPNIIRDSQMSISAATRMVLDNASITCGPNMEVNTDLLDPDTDVSAITAYKIWLRHGDDITAQWPAVRNVTIESHIDELLKLIELFMKFADAETFVGPATGGDMEKMPSEPMRTLGGASMLRGDAALPFKDIVRNFDQFTQSLIYAMVMFNKNFNPADAQEADYNVTARGATSLIAKELRAMQVDALAASLRPEEIPYVDMEKMAKARFAVRDLEDMMVPPDEAARRISGQQAQAAQDAQNQNEFLMATIRKLVSESYKNVAQGQKNNAMADAATVTSALTIMKQGMDNADRVATEQAPTTRNPAGPDAGLGGAPSASGLSQMLVGPGAGQADDVSAGGPGPDAGGGQGVQ